MGRLIAFEIGKTAEGLAFLCGSLHLSGRQFVKMKGGNSLSRFLLIIFAESQKMNRFLSLAFLAITVVGFSVTSGGIRADEKKHEAPKTSANEGFTKLQKLIGTWVAADAAGKPTEQVVSVFKSTGGGSTIQETIFPGSDHEMVTMYHMDGKDLVLTHYCAAGNQPKMKLDPKSPAKQLNFLFVGGTNFDPAKDTHMHEGRITLIDDDHIEWTWMGHSKGQPSNEHKVSMKLIRKKS